MQTPVDIPAFPHAHEKTDHPKWSASSGMSLRDWFAGNAMQGMMASDGRQQPAEYKSLAICAYGVADAMLAARDPSKQT